MNTTLSRSSDILTWKREDRQRIDDGAVMVMCNVTVKQDNGPSLNLPKTVTVYVGLVLEAELIVADYMECNFFFI